MNKTELVEKVKEETRKQTPEIIEKDNSLEKAIDIEDLKDKKEKFENDPASYRLAFPEVKELEKAENSEAESVSIS